MFASPHAHKRKGLQLNRLQALFLFPVPLALRPGKAMPPEPCDEAEAEKASSPPVTLAAYELFDHLIELLRVCLELQQHIDLSRIE